MILALKHPKNIYKKAAAVLIISVVILSLVPSTEAGYLDITGGGGELRISGGGGSLTITGSSQPPTAIDQLHYRWRNDTEEIYDWSASSVKSPGDNVQAGIDILEDSSGNLFWSFGSDNSKAYLYKSVDNGSSWSTSSVQDTLAAVRSGIDIFEDSHGNLFWSFGSADDKAYLYKSTDKGESWSASSVITTGGNIYSGIDILEDSSGNLFWSFGSDDENAYLYKSTDNGNSWSASFIKNVGDGRPNPVESGIEIFEDSHGNLFWSFGTSYGDVYLYKSVDNGSSWSISSIESAGDEVNSDIDILEDSSGNLFWSFGSLDDKAYLYKSTDNGWSWSISSVVTTGGNVEGGVEIFEDSSGNLFWSFGSWDNNAYLYKSVDNGSSWSISSIKSTGADLDSDIDILEDSLGNLFWSFGSDDTNAYLYKSVDNGNSWSTSSIKTTGDAVNHGLDILEDSLGNLFWSFGSLDDNAYLYKSSPSAIWMAAEDTATSTSKNTNVRVRFLVENTGAAASGYNYRLQWAERGSYANCTSAEPYVTWHDVATTTGEAVIMATSPYFDDQDNTTNISGGLTDPLGSSWVSGYMVEYPSNQTDPLTLDTDQFTELEYNFQFTDNTVTSTTYCFRVTNAGAPLDSYSQVAEITPTGGGVASRSLDRIYAQDRTADRPQLVAGLGPQNSSAGLNTSFKAVGADTLHKNSNFTNFKFFIAHRTLTQLMAKIVLLLKSVNPL